MKATIGFVGFGNVNSTMAEFAVKAGYRVVLSNSRGPDTLAAAVAKLGPQASASTVEDAVQQSDVVSVSIPFKSLEQLPVAPFIGKIVIDSMNYYPERDGQIEELDRRLCTTSELVQRHLQGAIVVKAFNSIDQFHFRFGARPAADPARWALPIAGDSIEAKAALAEFVDAIGFDPVDCGSLAESWRIQQHTPGYCLPYVGELPEGKTTRELLEWVKHDHSRVVKPADIKAMASTAVNSGRTGQLFTDFPAEYTALFKLDE